MSPSTLRSPDRAPQLPGSSANSSVVTHQRWERRSAQRTNEWRRWYLPVPIKFSMAMAVAGLWMLFSAWLALPWAEALTRYVGGAGAWLLIIGVALIPGFMNAFMSASLAMDRRPPRMPMQVYPGLTVLVAAYNEEDNILDTLHSIEAQHYPGPLQVIVVNDGSRDRTADRVRSCQARMPWLSLLDLRRNRGKANALNAAFELAAHSLVATVDGDSWLYRDALKNIVERYMQDPLHTRAVAGAVMVRNSRFNWLTRMQEWDYFQGISAAKRVQSMYQGVLVAQGAFSLYDREVIRQVGGFPDCVGEDIVLTWAILMLGHRVGHCEDALSFTNVPTTVRQFARQRHRWARGMIEAFKRYPSILFRPRMSTIFIFWNLQFPFLDLCFSLIFIPGLVAAMLGYHWVAGSMTMTLIPLAFLINLGMRQIGIRNYRANGLKIRSNWLGFFNYSLFYGFLMQPVSLWGYAAELLNLRKQWGTK